MSIMKQHKPAPITFRETLVIITLFMIVFGLIFSGLIALFYVGIIVLILLIFERIIGVLFYPRNSKEMLFLDRIMGPNQLTRPNNHNSKHSYNLNREWANRAEWEGWPTGI